MGKQDRVRHTAYMRLWRARKKHGLTGKVPQDELEKEITKIKMEAEGKRLKEQADLEQELVKEKREKLLGIHVPESTKPKEKNPFDLPFYSEPKEEKKVEIVYQRVDSKQFDFLKDLFSGEAEETTLDHERKIGQIVHEQGGASYEDIMKGLGESERSLQTRIYRRPIDPFFRERDRFRQKAHAVLEESLTRDDSKILSGIHTPEDLARAREWLKTRVREDEND